MLLEIPFTKLHGDENDFLLTWQDAVRTEQDLPEIARRICARNTGIGADGWMLVARNDDGLTTRLFNSDGSEPEISGNGTRCAAAFALEKAGVTGPELTIKTAAGPKRLRLIERSPLRFLFEMDMGSRVTVDLHGSLRLAGRDFDAVLLDVGNPQCVFVVDEFPLDWRSVAAEAEGHSRFPKRTNVSFVKPLDRHAIAAVFYERGAGETRSSGTGSTGAGVAAVLRGVVESPLEINTPAGLLHLRWDESVFLTGPAETVGEGVFFLPL